MVHRVRSPISRSAHATLFPRILVIPILEQLNAGRTYTGYELSGSLSG
jgi:hypothetical protein